MFGILVKYKPGVINIISNVLFKLLSNVKLLTIKKEILTNIRNVYFVYYITFVKITNNFKLRIIN